MFWAFGDVWEMKKVVKFAVLPELEVWLLDVAFIIQTPCSLPLGTAEKKRDQKWHISHGFVVPFGKIFRLLNRVVHLLAGNAQQSIAE